MAFDSLIDNSNDESKSKRGGARAGAGRPKGSMEKSTKLRAAAKAEFQRRVVLATDKLFNAQLDKALGEKYLMVITTIGEGSKQRRETTIVTDPDTIKEYFDNDEDPNFGEDNEYYFISTKPADNMALDSLLNRAYGKAEEKLAVEHSGEIHTGVNDPQLAADFAEFTKQQSKE